MRPFHRFGTNWLCPPVFKLKCLPLLSVFRLPISKNWAAWVAALWTSAYPLTYTLSLKGQFAKNKMEFHPFSVHRMSMEFHGGKEFHPVPMQWTPAVGMFSNIKKNGIKNINNMPPYCLPDVIQVSWQWLGSPIWLKAVMLTAFLAKICICVCSVQKLSRDMRSAEMSAVYIYMLPELFLDSVHFLSREAMVKI